MTEGELLRGRRIAGGGDESSGGCVVTEEVGWQSSNAAVIKKKKLSGPTVKLLYGWVMYGVCAADCLYVRYAMFWKGRPVPLITYWWKIVRMFLR